MTTVFKDLSDFKDAIWPLWLKAEIAELSNHNAATNISVYCQNNEQCVLVFADIERDTFGEKPANSVQQIERVIFHYVSFEAWGIAPSLYIDREDFPRNLSHLNPVPTGYPASPCVALAGSQAIYDQGGIRLLVDRLVSWLTDAARGTLTHDGWEPALVSNRRHFGEIDFKHFQEVGFSTYRAVVTPILRNPAEVPLYYINIQPSKNDNNIYNDPKLSRKIDGFFIQTPSIISIPSPIYVNSIEDLFFLAKKLNIYDKIKRLITEKCNHQCMIILVIGIKRPQKLREHIMGLSEGSNRNIEIIGWIIESSIINKEATINITGIELVSKVTQKLLQNTSSNQNKIPNCTIIGCGALGSFITQMFAQTGAGKINVIDNDLFMPHNSARHILGKFFSGFPKSEALKWILESNTEVNIDASVTDVCKLNNISFSSTAKASHLVIDATASAKVRDHLCRLDIKQKVVRAELADQGELGLLYVEGEGRNPRLDDLDAYLYTLGYEDDRISQWLRSGSQLDSLDIGLGCASATMRMSSATVQNHAATFFNALTRQQEQSAGLGINVLENGLPQGWKWHTVPPVECMNASVFGSADSSAWEIRVSKDVMDTIHNLLTVSLPKETGGFLYGKLDVFRQVMYVVKAFQGGILSASSTSLQLDKAGATTEEQVFQRRTGHHLMLLGSWHTHPFGSANLSTTDKAEAVKISLQSNEHPRPFLMLIASQSDLQANVIYPQQWMSESGS